jgi:hypothetical protein
MALVVTTIGIAGASTVMERQPIVALITAIATIVLPVAIATRVAWASGYAAGLTVSAKGIPGEPAQSPKQTSSDSRIYRIAQGPDS